MQKSTTSRPDSFVIGEQQELRLSAGTVGEKYKQGHARPIVFCQCMWPQSISPRTSHFGTLPILEWVFFK